MECVRPLCVYNPADALCQPHRALLNAASRGLVDECARLMGQMHDAGLEPGSRAYHVWVFAAVKNADMRGAEEIARIAQEVASGCVYRALRAVCPSDVRAGCHACIAVCAVCAY